MGIGEVEGCGGAMDAYRRAMGVIGIVCHCVGCSRLVFQWFKEEPQQEVGCLGNPNPDLSANLMLSEISESLSINYLTHSLTHPQLDTPACTTSDSVGRPKCRQADPTPRSRSS